MFTINDVVRVALQGWVEVSQVEFCVTWHWRCTHADASDGITEFAFAARSWISVYAARLLSTAAKNMSVKVYRETPPGPVDAAQVTALWTQGLSNANCIAPTSCLTLRRNIGAFDVPCRSHIFLSPITNSILTAEENLFQIDSSNPDVQAWISLQTTPITLAHGGIFEPVVWSRKNRTAQTIVSVHPLPYLGIQPKRRLR